MFPKIYLTLPAAVPRIPSRELFSSSNASKVDDTEKVNITQVLSQPAWFPCSSNWGPA